MKPTVSTAIGAPVLDLLGMKLSLLVSDADSDRALMVGELHVSPGQGIPPHVHTREDEVFHVLEGRLTFTVGEREVAAGAGTTVFGPRNSPHALRNDSDQPARVLLMLAPGHLQSMFAEFDRLPKGAPDPALVAEITGRYGISFV